METSFAVSDKVSESVHIIANEPSLAFYRIQEHVRKSLPVLVDKRVGELSITYKDYCVYAIVHDHSNSCMLAA